MYKAITKTWLNRSSSSPAKARARRRSTRRVGALLRASGLALRGLWLRVCVLARREYHLSGKLRPHVLVIHRRVSSMHLSAAHVISVWRMCPM